MAIPTGTAQEASDAAAAVCNLGPENWPPHWPPADAAATPGSFLVDQHPVGVFQVGWAALHHDVIMCAAEQMTVALTRVRCDNREIQKGLDALRTKTAQCLKAGAPWRAGGALYVIASLNMLTWAALLSLIDECPALHAGVGALRDSRTHTVSASGYEFISENGQIASVRDFTRSLPETPHR